MKKSRTRKNSGIDFDVERAKRLGLDPIAYRRWREAGIPHSVLTLIGTSDEEFCEEYAGLVGEMSSNEVAMLATQQIASNWRNAFRLDQFWDYSARSILLMGLLLCRYAIPVAEIPSLVEALLESFSHALRLDWITDEEFAIDAVEAAALLSCRHGLNYDAATSAVSPWVSDLSMQDTEELIRRSQLITEIVSEFGVAFKVAIKFVSELPHTFEDFDFRLRVSRHGLSDDKEFEDVMAFAPSELCLRYVDRIADLLLVGHHESTDYETELILYKLLKEDGFPAE